MFSTSYAFDLLQQQLVVALPLYWIDISGIYNQQWRFIIAEEILRVGITQATQIIRADSTLLRAITPAYTLHQHF